jgi:hypothetical protein
MPSIMACRVFTGTSAKSEISVGAVMRLYS